MRIIDSNKLKMREHYLSFQKYSLNSPYYGVLSYLIIVSYVSSLKKMGAYDQALLNKINKINKINTQIAFFCKAEINFLKGNYSESLSNLSLLEKFNYNIDEVKYLLYKNYIMLGKRLAAQNTLYELLKFSDRNKTWMYLANSIETKQEFLVFEEKFKNKVSQKNQFLNINLRNYYSEAAIRAGEYEKAINNWIVFIKLIKENKIRKKNIKKIFDSNNAEDALLDLRSLLVEQGVEFFLVSGTLLGCIRDNSILKHDKDLDIGIYESAIKEIDLKKIFQSSGFFEILPTRIVTQIKLKHLNGTYIDVFIHQVNDDICWHYTSKIKWFNTPFNLKKIKFLNHDFLVPENTDLYLSENYGSNWCIPQVDFDSNFDTPNAVIINLPEMQVFYVKMLAYKFLYNDIDSRYLQRIYENLSNEVKLCLKKELVLVS